MRPPSENALENSLNAMRIASRFDGIVYADPKRIFISKVFTHIRLASRRPFV
jgi:hypothetical protein